MAFGDDDLSLAIQLVLGESPEVARGFADLIQRIEGPTRKAAEDLGRTAGNATAKGVKEGIDRAAKQAAEAMRRSNKVQEQILLEGIRSRRAAQQRADQREAEEATARERRLSTAQEGGWKRRLIQAKAAADAQVSNQRSANRRAEQDQSGSIRRGIAQLRADLTRRNDAIKAGLSRGLITERADLARRNNEERAAAARRLQGQKGADVLAYAEEQGSQARRTVLLRSFLHSTEAAWKFSLGVVRDTVKSHLRRREEDQRAGNARELALTESAARRQATAVRLGIDKENASYTRGASARLRTIELTTAEETRVVTRAQVRQAEAVAKAQKLSQSGIVGAATGRSSIGSGLLLGAATFGGVAAIHATVEAASDLVESQNKFNVVFARTSESTKRALRSFAENAASSLGISKQAALETASTFGNLFSALRLTPDLAANMSRSLVKLAADLASFNNVNPADALKALQSGIVGQVRPLRQFGVYLSKARIEAEAYRLGIVKAVSDPVKVEAANLAIEKAIAARGKAIKKFGADSLQARTATNQVAAGETRLAKALKGSKVELTAAQKAQATYSIILTDTKLAQGDFARTSNQLANAQRIAAARMADTRATLGKFLLPLYLRFVTVSSQLTRNLVRGNGAFKIVRDGLVGIAAALAAIIAVKAAVTVIELLGVGLTALSAHPVIGLTVALAGLAGVLFGLVKNYEPVKRFFSSLIEGTKNWIIVGYKIGTPIRGLSNIVKITSGLGAAIRNIHDLFFGLVEGFKNWAIVGYKIDGPIKGLSNIVLIQSSIGAAARVIVDHVEDIIAVLSYLFHGGNFGTAENLVRGIFGDLADRIRGIAGPVGKAIGGVVDEARTELRRRFGALFAGAGAFVKAGGLGAIRDVIVSAVQVAVDDAHKVVDDFFGGLFHGVKVPDLLTLSGVGQRSADLSIAQKLGDRLHRILAGLSTKGFDFFGGLFDSKAAGKKAADGNASAQLGIRLRGIIGGAFRTLRGGLDLIGGLFTSSKATEGIRKFLGNAAGAVGRFFTTSVLPKLIDLPRLLGKFLSQTIFSERVMKTLLKTVGVIGGIAAVIAFQFIRGFAEGLYKRKGDIADTIRDILVFAAKAVIGSGNPLLVLGGLIAAVFVGAKVLTPITKFIQKLGELRINSKRALAELRGDTARSTDLYQQLIDKRQKYISSGTGKGIPAAASAARGVYDSTREGFGRLVGATVGGYSRISVAARTAASFTQRVYSTQLAPLARGALTNLRSTYDTLGRHAKDAAVKTVSVLDAVNPRAGAAARVVINGVDGALHSVANTARDARQRVLGVMDSGASRAAATGKVALATLRTGYEKLGTTAKATGTKMLTALENVSPAAAGAVRQTLDKTGKAYSAVATAASAAKTKIRGFFASPGSANTTISIVDRVKAGFAQVGESAQRAKARVSDFFGSFKTVSTVGLSGGALEAAETQNLQAFERRATAAQGVAQTAAAAISGYFIGAADTTTEKTLGMVAAAGNVAVAFASPGGEILGPLTLLGTAVGAIFGNMKKRADEAKAQAKASAAEVARISGEFKSSIGEKGLLSSKGTITEAGRLRSVLDVLHTELGTSTTAGSKFFDRFDVGFRSFTTAFAKGDKAFKGFLSSIARDRTADIFAGNTAAIKEFGSEVDRTASLVAKKAATFALQQQGAGLPLSKFQNFTLTRGLEDLSKKFLDGKESATQFRAELVRNGATAAEVNQTMKALRTTLADQIEASAKAQFGGKISPALQRALDELKAQGQLQQLIDKANEASKSPVDKLKDAFSKLQDAIAKTSDEYRTYLDVIDGGKADLAQARINISSSAADAVNLGGKVTADEQTVALQEGKRNFADAYGQLVKQATKNGVVDQEKLNSLVDDFRAKLVAQVLPQLQEQNDSLGDAALSQDALIKKANEYVNNVLQPERDAQKALLDLQRQRTIEALKLLYIQRVYNEEVKKEIDRRAAKGIGVQVKGTAGETRLAVGGIIRKPTRALVGEAGPEVVIPLNDPKRAADLLRLSGLTRINSPLVPQQPFVPTHDFTPTARTTGQHPASPIFETLAQSLRGVANLARQDANAAAFFRMMRGASEKLRDFMSGVAAEVANIQPPTQARPLNVPTTISGRHFTPTQLSRLATPEPRTSTAPGVEPVTQAQLDGVVAAIKDLNGDNYEVKVYGQAQPIATGHEVVRQVKANRYLRVASRPPVEVTHASR